MEIKRQYKRYSHCFILSIISAIKVGLTFGSICLQALLNPSSIFLEIQVYGGRGTWENEYDTRMDIVS
jgi:hypothetical protein